MLRPYTQAERDHIDRTVSLLLSSNEIRIREKAGTGRGDTGGGISRFWVSTNRVVDLLGYRNETCATSETANERALRLEEEWLKELRNTPINWQVAYYERLRQMKGIWRLPC